MGLHIPTIQILIDTKKINKILKDLEAGFSKKYIRETYNLTIRQLQHIERIYSDRIAV